MQGNHMQCHEYMYMYTMVDTVHNDGWPMQLSRYWHTVDKSVLVYVFTYMYAILYTLIRFGIL